MVFPSQSISNPRVRAGHSATPVIPATAGAEVQRSQNQVLLWLYSEFKASLNNLANLSQNCKRGKDTVGKRSVASTGYRLHHQYSKGGPTMKL